MNGGFTSLSNSQAPDIASRFSQKLSILDKPEETEVFDEDDLELLDGHNQTEPDQVSGRISMPMKQL